MVPELVEARERVALVVSDQKDEALSCVTALEAGGFVTYHVADHHEALARGRALNPHCVVVNCALRENEGLALLRELKSVTPHIRVVVVAAIGSIRGAVQAMKLGAADYLAKPVRPEDLLSAVDPDRHVAASGVEPKIPTLAQARDQYVQSVLNYTGGNISEAARLLGLHRQSLQRMLRRRASRS